MFGLSSEFCIVHVLLGLGNLSALQNTGISAFQGFRLYTIAFGTKRSVLNVVDDRFSGVSTRHGSTACVTNYFLIQTLLLLTA